MNRQRKVLITTTYNEMGIIIDTKAEEVTQPNLQPTCNQLATDCISRQAAFEVIDAAFPVDPMKSEYTQGLACGMAVAKAYVEQLPSAQPEQTDCDYCHENLDGYVRPIEKNSHAFIYFGMNGWELNLRAKGWHGSAKIMYCPMCGRRLERG